MTAIAARTAIMVVLAGLLTVGCLLKVDTHTWYLEPDTGEVTWMVSERDVRSDAKAAADRLNEETTWWNEVQAGSHSTARAFQRLAALDVETRVLRSRVPFHVVTEASFPAIDELGRRLILVGGLSGTSTIRREGDLVQWTMTVRDPHLAGEPSDEDVSALLGGLSELRVVLARGRFESATGFALEQDRRVATFEEPDDEADVMVLQLVWTGQSRPAAAGGRAASDWRAAMSSGSRASASR